MSLIDHSDTRYDQDLAAIDHLSRIPAMMPFVGKDYIHASHKRLLLIGESGYFPPESTCHKSPDDWYRLHQSELNEEELCYLNWRSLIGNEWTHNGHEMYREINRFMREITQSDEPRAVSHAAYVNAFFRPATEPGESIKHSLTSLDIEQGLSTTGEIIDCLQADVVVFLSKFTWDTFGWQLAASKPNVKMEFTAHAADRRWFHRRNYPHAKPKLMEFLQANFVN